MIDWVPEWILTLGADFHPPPDGYKNTLLSPKWTARSQNDLKIWKALDSPNDSTVSDGNHRWPETARRAATNMRIIRKGEADPVQHKSKVTKRLGF